MTGEYRLRDALRAEGYEADRVPSSGAAQGFKGDVRFRKGGIEWVAELKCRKDTFKSIYALYDNHKDELKRVAISTPGVLVSIHTCMEDAIQGPLVYLDRTCFPKERQRAIRKLENMRSLLQQSDILVVKDDYKPFLYIRYR